MNLDEIYLGDAYELIKRIPDKSVDLIVTDPPYDIPDTRGGGILKDKTHPYMNEIGSNGIGKGIDLRILEEFVRVEKKINCYIWCNKSQIYDYMTFFVKERKCSFDILIWGKKRPVPFYGGHYLTDKEYCLVFWEEGANPKPKDMEHAKTIFLSYPDMEARKKYGHPTIKPEAWIEKMIENSSREGGVILDPFMGSGTTAVACKRTGRHFLGFEINEAYYKACERRLSEITLF